MVKRKKQKFKINLTGKSDAYVVYNVILRVLEKIKSNEHFYRLFFISIQLFINIIMFLSLLIEQFTNNA